MSSAKAAFLREDSLRATEMFFDDHATFLVSREKEILVARALAGPVEAKDVVMKVLRAKIRNLEKKIASAQSFAPSTKLQLEETLGLTKLAFQMTRNPSKY
jgi:hypothetical protein